MEPQQGGKINWKIVLLGGGAVIVVILLVMKSGSTSNPPANSTPTTSTDGTSTNAGTPSNNGSFDVFTDPISGIRWILDASSGTWIPTSTPTTSGSTDGGAGQPIPAPQGGLDIPTGGLPPLTRTDSPVPTTAVWDMANTSWLNPAFPTLPGGQ